MDHFGIGIAIEGMIQNYIIHARSSGRTTSLVESLKDGDRVVCMNEHHAKHIKELCIRRRIKIDCMVVNPSQPERLWHIAPSIGRTLLDHTWVEEFYIDSIRNTQKYIDKMQREASGEGTAHEQTRQTALSEREMRKWIPITLTDKEGR